GNVADKRMRTVDRDLPAAGEVEMPQTADIAGKAGSRSVACIHTRNSDAGGALVYPTGGSASERAVERYGIEPRPLYELHRYAAECAEVSVQRVALIREHHARERARQHEMTGLERNPRAGELIGKPGHPERGVTKHAGRNAGLLDLGILVHDAADPAQIDVERLDRPAAHDDASRRSIVGHRVENSARVLQASVDDLDRGNDVFGGAQHLGESDAGPLQRLAHDEGELDLDPRPAIILVRNLGAVRDHHIVEEVPIIRLVDLRGVLHSLRRQADLVADQLRSGRDL